MGFKISEISSEAKAVMAMILIVGAGFTSAITWMEVKFVGAAEYATKSERMQLDIGQLREAYTTEKQTQRFEFLEEQISKYEEKYPDGSNTAPPRIKNTWNRYLKEYSILEQKVFDKYK